MLNSNKGARGGRGGKSLNSCVVKALVMLSIPSLPTHLLRPLLPQPLGWAFWACFSAPPPPPLPKREKSFHGSKLKWGDLGNI